MNDEIWVLGATGRTGTAIATALHGQGERVVLTSRSPERVQDVAARLSPAPRVVSGDFDSVLRELTTSAPAVVVNTVGPFTETAPAVVTACPPGTHYVDLSNEPGSITALLDRTEQANSSGRTLVTGAGSGVLATESALLRACAGRPRPSRVRVDVIPSVATEEGVLGTALARSIVTAMAEKGRQVREGRLTPVRSGADPARLTTPDGDVVTSGSLFSGELVAAWRAGESDQVTAASVMAPTGRVASLAMAGVPALLRVPGLARFATARLASVRARARPRPRAHSWGHAVAEWPSGEVRETWLRAGDAMDFTVAVATEVARRLARGEGRRGAFTPGALFGAELAEAAGGEFVEQP